MKKYFSIFVYISIAFLLISLLKSDYLIVPKVYSVDFLVLSIGSLIGSFLLFALRWKKFLTLSGLPVSYKNSLISIGMSVFGRYIPGKVLLILGQALYLKEKYDYSVKKVSALATHNQLLELWVGLVLGSLPFLFISQKIISPYLILLFLIFLSLAVFSKAFHRPANFLFSKILKKEIQIPQLQFRNIIKIIPITILELSLKALGFYFLLKATFIGEFGLIVGFFFLLAQILGIMALIAPGGIGVREGLLVSFLALVGLELKDSINISIISRLWYLIGESLLFLSAIIAKFGTQGIIKHE